MTVNKIIDEINMRIKYLEERRSYLKTEMVVREGGPTVFQALQKRLDDCNDELETLYSMRHAARRPGS